MNREIDEEPSHLPDAQRKQMWYSHLNAKLENPTYGKLPDEFGGQDVFNYFIKLHYLYILIHTLLKLLVETARPVPAIPPFTSDPLTIIYPIIAVPLVLPDHPVFPFPH